MKRLTMFKVAIGHSEDPDTEDAVQEVITQCLSSLEGAKPQAGIVFSAVNYDYPIILKKINASFPNIQLIGCSSGGELSSQLGYSEGTLLLLVFASDTVSMATAVARDISIDISSSVNAALKEAKQKLKSDPTLCLTFPDIFTIGTVRLVEELKKSLGSTFPILGGGASDPWKFDQTREFYGEEVLQDAAPMLFFSGPLEYHFNVVSGWQPFTSKKVVMECNKNIVYKIGDETALDFYKHYLGSPPSLAHPLAVFEKDQERFYLRVPLGADEKTGEVVLGGDLPKEAVTSICQADPQELIQETHKLIQQIQPKLSDNKAACAFIISCSCRQKVLGTRTKEEYKVLRDEIFSDIPIVGFYAYGQICPFEQDKCSFVHNESVVALLLNEKYEHE
jgi:hypothetical protein